MKGISKTRIYRILMGMRTRCNNPADQHYKNYGGKGVKVCDQWMGADGAQAFYNWALNNGYEEHLTIDRIDPNGDYCPENCRWLTLSENVARVEHPERLDKESAPEIYRIRESTGLSQSKFSAALNIPVRTLQQWEIGARSCPEYVVELIAYRVQHDPVFRKEKET